MSRLRLILAPLAALAVTVLFWLWVGAKALVTLIGATTVGDDFNQLVERLPKWAEWLFSTPWYVPAALATALTLFLIWLSWPSAAPSPSASVETLHPRLAKAMGLAIDPADDALFQASQALPLGPDITLGIFRFMQGELTNSALHLLDCEFWPAAGSVDGQLS